MNQPTINDRVFLKQAGAIIKELNQTSSLTHDPNNLGWVSKAWLDARDGKKILRMVYIFESIPRPRMFFKSDMSLKDVVVLKDEDAEFEGHEEDANVFALDDLLDIILEYAIPKTAKVGKKVEIVELTAEQINYVLVLAEHRSYDPDEVEEAVDMLTQSGIITSYWDNDEFPIFADTLKGNDAKSYFDDNVVGED